MLSHSSGMSQFGQMGMQSMGQRSTPPLPPGAPMNQVSALSLSLSLSLSFFLSFFLSWGSMFPTICCLDFGCEFVDVLWSLSSPDGHGTRQDGSAQHCPATEPVPPPGTVPRARSESRRGPRGHEPAGNAGRHAAGEPQMSACKPRPPPRPICS